MVEHRLFRSSLKVKKISQALDKMASLGYEYVDMFEATFFFFFHCIYLVGKKTR